MIPVKPPAAADGPMPVCPTGRSTRRRSGRAPLTTKLAGGGIAVLFRHGVAVLLDAPAPAEQALRERLDALDRKLELAARTERTLVA